MILIHPMKDIRHPATDETRWHINYVFAELLQKYIKLKGDDCMLSRKSEAAVSMDIKALSVNYTPVLCWTIDCYVDISPDTSGYDIQCSEYSAFVGTLTYETYMQGRTPITNLGYTETNSLKYGSEADVTFYLGYATNKKDLEYLQNKENLDKLAKRIIEGEYGPPVRQIEDTDTTGNGDPYFYRFDTWKEETVEEGSSAKISEELQSGLPIRFLQIDSKVSGNYLVDPSDDDPIVIPKVYTWSTPLTYTQFTSCLVICSIRSLGTNPTAYIKVGEKVYTEVITDTAWKILIFEADVSQNDTIQIGVQGTGRLDYTGIWIAPKGSLGTLDDPRSSYSIFPPGYRTVSKQSSAYNNADAIHVAITTAKSLIERLKDTTKSNLGIQQTNAELANTSGSTSSGNKVVSFVFSALGYAQALGDLMGMLANLNPKTLGIVDPKNINVDYKGLENSIASISDMSQKADLLMSVNDIKNVAGAVSSATISTDDLNKDAEEIAESTLSTIEKKGGDIGKQVKNSAAKTTATLNNKTSRINSNASNVVDNTKDNTINTKSTISN